MRSASQRRRNALPRTSLRFALISGLLLGAVACGNANADRPDWRPQPEFQGDGGQPAPPGQQAEPNTTPAVPSKPGGSPGPSPSQSGDDPSVMATNLDTPTGLVVMPDGTALVGERRTGRIMRVQPQAKQPVTEVRTIAGLDSSGDGGLLDLALSSTYSQDGLIYAYITTSTDNRVIDFTLTGAASPVVTGIPKCTTGNTGRLLFAADGSFYLGTSDTGQPALAQNPTSLAGKVLHYTGVGRPVGTTAVFTSGHHTVNGLCATNAGAIFTVEAAQSGTAQTDEVNVLIPGKDFGWPTTTTTSEKTALVAAPSKGGYGDCAVSGPQFYVTSRDAPDLLGTGIISSSPGAARFGTLVSEKVTKYGRLLTVVAAPDGALWLTTTNKDGLGKPVPTDERVIRIELTAGGSDSPV
jgi:glucose/arabinose dehydrogenase